MLAGKIEFVAENAQEHALMHRSITEIVLLLKESSENGIALFLALLNSCESCLVTFQLHH